MKKTLLLSSVAALFAFNANALDIKPYVGLDYAYSEANLSSDLKDIVEKNYHSLNLNIGTKVHKNLGVEIFYQQSGEQKGELAQNYITGQIGKLTSKFNAFGADLTGYLPVFEKTEAFASLGMGRYNVSVKGVGVKGSEHHWSPRIGLGLMYNLTEHFALRAQARYVRLDIDDIDDIKEVSFGIRYNF